MAEYRVKVEKTEKNAQKRKTKGEEGRGMTKTRVDIRKVEKSKWIIDKKEEIEEAVWRVAAFKDKKVMENERGWVGSNVNTSV